MKPLIKWPGGKSGEIKYIEGLIPGFDRYIEPFFGGGAVFFHLKPKKALVNDISPSLMAFYGCAKAQNPEMHRYLLCYHNCMENLMAVCRENQRLLFHLYHKYTKSVSQEEGLDLEAESEKLMEILQPKISTSAAKALVLDFHKFYECLAASLANKIRRLSHIGCQQEDGWQWLEDNLIDNLATGFISGFYTYFRSVYNDLNLSRLTINNLPYQSANFYFIREYCYGAMFRYNAAGEFNIPYGGMSYNKKNLAGKISHIYGNEVAAVFENTTLSCMDFQRFLENAAITKKDFIFLDPPYDTDFSDYDGNTFSHQDQVRLSQVLKNTKGRFILVIKSTAFIYNLYAKDFNILTFDNQYTYNVRSRNNRKAEHLIITNLPV